MRKVTIIGAGPGNPDLLSRAALDAIDIADVVIGAHRALVGIDVLSEQVEHHQVATLGSPWFREEVGHQLSVVGEGLATR